MSEPVKGITKGTRHMLGRESKHFRQLTNGIMTFLEGEGYMEFIPSALAYQDLFIEKAGPEVVGQMYAFKDKADPPRELCLIPEVTAICQRLYKDVWSKSMKKPVKIAYLTRCYRYERPQMGRYREFWQLGVECMGGTDPTPVEEMTNLLTEALRSVGLEGFTLNKNVKRGLDYYVADGFEVEVARLGAQKQVAGGGRYDCGIGWAIGIDRLMLSVFGNDVMGMI